MMTLSQRVAVGALVAASLAACAGTSHAGNPLTPSAAPTGAAAGTRPSMGGHSVLPTPKATPTASQLGNIKHVILMIQENRTVDNMFQGYPGANTASSGVTSTGQVVQLQPIPIHVGFDVSHGVQDFLAACDGGAQGMNCKNDAFDLERVSGQTKFTLPMFSYVPQSDTTLYWQLANQYVLADNSFQSHVDASFVGHQYLIASQAQRAVDLPHGVWGCPASVATLNDDRTIGASEKACWDEPTIASELDSAGLTWKMYAPIPKDPGFNWVAFRAIKPVFYGPEWKANISHPNTNILTDITNGTLPSMSWIIPSFAESDHESAGNTTGENWVSTVVNAVGASPYWSSTAIIVTWDDWGGFYDHVAPKYLDYDGLGFRTPVLVISPYAKQGYVSHVAYEFGSITQFAEDVFGLGRLAPSDTRANSLVPDCFNFQQRRRAFKRLPTTISPQQFIRDAQTPQTIITQADGD